MRPGIRFVVVGKSGAVCNAQGKWIIFFDESPAQELADTLGPDYEVMAL